MGPSSDILEDERDRAPGLRVALPALWRDATRQIATSGNRRGKTSDRRRPSVTLISYLTHRHTCFPNQMTLVNGPVHKFS